MYSIHVMFVKTFHFQTCTCTCTCMHTSTNLSNVDSLECIVHQLVRRRIIMERRGRGLIQGVLVRIVPLYVFSQSPASGFPRLQYIHMLSLLLLSDVMLLVPADSFD